MGHIPLPLGISGRGDAGPSLGHLGDCLGKWRWGGGAVEDVLDGVLKSMVAGPEGLF